MPERFLLFSAAKSFYLVVSCLSVVIVGGSAEPERIGCAARRQAGPRRDQKPPHVLPAHPQEHVGG